MVTAIFRSSPTIVFNSMRTVKYTVRCYVVIIHQKQLLQACSSFVVDGSILSQLKYSVLFIYLVLLSIICGFLQFSSTRHVSLSSAFLLANKYMVHYCTFHVKNAKCKMCKCQRKLYGNLWSQHPLEYNFFDYFQTCGLKS